jgi:rSAM/selenodomain-associated transferase 1
MVGRLLAALEPLRADLVVYLDQVWSPPWESAGESWLQGLDVRVQQGEDLGRRMAGAFREVFAGGASQALLVGSDIPGIDSPLVERYFRRLGSHSMVLGPSHDGGYYLIGFRRESFRPEIFEDIPWSTDAVSRLTLQAAGRLGLSCDTGPVLRDVDTLEDLGALEPPPR